MHLFAVNISNIYFTVLLHKPVTPINFSDDTLLDIIHLILWDKMEQQNCLTLPVVVTDWVKYMFPTLLAAVKGHPSYKFANYWLLPQATADQINLITPDFFFILFLPFYFNYFFPDFPL